MARLVEATQSEARYILHGDPGAGAFEYMRNERDSIRSRLDTGSLTMRALDRRFFDTSESVLDSYSEQLHRVRGSAAVRKFSELTEEDVFKPLYDMAGWQSAKPVMRRWIMAMPEVRNRVRKGHLEGYGDLYYDQTPDLESEDHLDYRLMTDGIIETHDLGFTAMCVLGVEDAEKPSYEEKLIWSDMRQKIVESLLSVDDDDDPTSPWGSDKLC